MEQPRMRTPQPRRGAQQESATVHRAGQRPPGAPGPAGLRRFGKRLPGPRLTGLGCGLASLVVMIVGGTLDGLLLDAAALPYGLLFLLTSALCALWVRPSDLVAAPISAPIAFAAGLVPVSGGSGGFGSQVMAVFTQLALQAGWLYGGTLTAVLIVVVRKVLLLGSRARRTGSTPRTPGGGQPTAERPQPESA
ncbi:DUF6542 domain-containing protein [Streptomyces sp. NPDC002055]|uniref:DUF6542 domain-containing protein n=1 Tax=Streptomyces sp. NPDC002055 TaxID=3154534 RepID=UPI00332A54F3